MDIGKHHTKLEKCVFVINSNDVVLWIHLFWLGPLLFHFLKLIEFLMRLSKRTNELIKNWQMALHSAVLGILPLCVCVCVHNASCVSVYVCVYVVGGQSMYGFIIMCSGAWPCLKTRIAEMTSLTETSEWLWHSKMSLFCFHTYNLSKSFISALYQHIITVNCYP